MRCGDNVKIEFFHGAVIAANHDKQRLVLRTGRAGIVNSVQMMIAVRNRDAFIVDAKNIEPLVKGIDVFLPYRGTPWIVRRKKELC